MKKKQDKPQLNSGLLIAVGVLGICSLPIEVQFFFVIGAILAGAPGAYLAAGFAFLLPFSLIGLGVYGYCINNRS